MTKWLKAIGIILSVIVMFYVAWFLAIIMAITIAIIAVTFIVDDYGDYKRTKQ